MKHIKVIAGLGLIPFGVFIGSFISIGMGNGAILGGILGGILYGILLYVPHWSGSNRLDEQDMVNNGDRQWIDNSVRGIQQAHIENEIRMRAMNHE